MRGLMTVIAACLAGLMAGAPADGNAPGGEWQEGVIGEWAGAIKIPGQELKIAVRFTGNEANPAGTIDIPQQGATGLALADISIEGERVAFSLPGVPGSPRFEGRLEGETISGDFTQGGRTFPFELTRGELAKPKRPQDPEPPFPYAQEEVTVRNGGAGAAGGAGGVTLAGTVTRPEGPGPFPAVVLISGSGPQNRDEEIFGHRPFAVLADHLSRAGIVVARYDDRGVGESTGTRDGATMSDYAGDAEAWMRHLKGREDVSKVGLLGHSEGGLIAAMIGARNPDVDFVILLAGPGVDGAATLVEQNRALAKTAGASDERADLIARRARELFDAVARGGSDQELRERIRALAEAQSGVEDAPGLDELIDQQLSMVRSPWFGEFLGHDPAEDLRRLSVPVLAIIGEKDVQVVASQHLPAIRSALKEGGNPDATVKELPGLNHLLQKSGSGAVAEYGRIEETMNPAALDLIRDWILARFGD